MCICKRIQHSISNTGSGGNTGDNSSTSNIGGGRGGYTDDNSSTSNIGSGPVT